MGGDETCVSFALRNKPLGGNLGGASGARERSRRAFAVCVCVWGGGEDNEVGHGPHLCSRQRRRAGGILGAPPFLIFFVVSHLRKPRSKLWSGRGALAWAALLALLLLEIAQLPQGTAEQVVVFSLGPSGAQQDRKPHRNRENTNYKRKPLIGLLHPKGANDVLSYPLFVREFFLSTNVSSSRGALEWLQGTSGGRKGRGETGEGAGGGEALLLQQLLHLAVAGRRAGVTPGLGTAGDGGGLLATGGVAMLQLFLRLRACGVGSVPSPVEARPAVCPVGNHQGSQEAFGVCVCVCGGGGGGGALRGVN